MLPSRGFFKKNDCPFYEKGSCKRPHCHFRHRKKVVSEITSNAIPQDLIVLKDIDASSLGDNVNSEKIEDASKHPDTDPKDQIQNSKETESNQDSLFAKLVNQSNPYEKLNRHIPCAYTPTPQTRGVQPKNKSVRADNNVNKIKAKEILKKTQNYNVSISSESSKLNSDTYVSTQSVMGSLNSDVLQKAHDDLSNKYSVNFLSSVTSKNTDCKNVVDNSMNNPCSISYEPQSTSKSIISNLGQLISEGSTSDYVPSKVTIPESQYSPYSSNSSLPDNYVPSKDNKPQRIQYVPKANVNITNEVIYKPSDKSSFGETKYQPGGSDIVTDYIPTEKSATKVGANGNSEWTDLDFISSEIEMMKKLLDEENEDLEKSKTFPKTESTEKRNKDTNKDLNCKSSHSSISKHKSTSRSHSRSSSSLKNSTHGSGKSSSSSHHHHHSSSSSRKSKSTSLEGHSKSSTSEDRKKNKNSDNGSHRSSRHHSSHKSHKRSKEKRKSVERDLKDQQEKKKLKSASGHDNTGQVLIHSTEETSDVEEKSKKRKNSWSDSERDVKMTRNEEDEMFAELEEDPDTIEKECLEIFNSYANTPENESTSLNHFSESPSSADDYEALGKKRTAHATTVISDHSVLRNKTIKKVNKIKSAQEVMLERYKILEKAKETATKAPLIPAAPILGLNRPSIRIAAVSNIQQMLNAKKAIQEKIDRGIKVNERTTIAQTLVHGGSRIAHTPATNSTKAMIEKPTIKEGSKQVPLMKRQIYLDKLILETKQIYPTKEESISEAVKLEEEIYRAHLNSFAAYHTAYMSALIRTKRRISALKGETSSSISRTKVSHSDVLAGGKKNFSVIKVKKVDIGMLSERHIYEELLRCKLTPEELKENSYPMNGKNPGYATCILNMELKYNAHYAHIKKMTGNRRYCIRCSKQYEVDPETLKQYKEGPETCSYHPGKKKSGGRNSERIYNCCNSSSTEGCTSHVRHVTDCNDYENLPNCVRTFPKEHETNPGIFALDCEMVYTRLGYELARVTVVNLKKEVVYDTLVKPKYPVDCYNTFYSGIEEKMLDGVKTTLSDVQAVLLSMFSNKTILIGHSLDSDLRALHLIHDTVVDTAVVYKNEKYHPYKYSLKDLCARKISKIIQDNVGGHDSAEDATAALEIMLNHVKEEVSKYDSLESYEADRMN